jgi:ferritin
MINGLMDLAIKEKDYATQTMLAWFVKEQVEEEANASEILAQIKMLGSVVGHLFYLDHQLSKRE